MIDGWPVVLRMFAPFLLRISSAHALHWSRVCHVIFKRAHWVENSTKYRADDLCVNFVCKYFCWMLGDPHFFWANHFLFWFFPLYWKTKNLQVGSFNYFSYTIQIGSNWCMNTGVCDLQYRSKVSWHSKLEPRDSILEPRCSKRSRIESRVSSLESRGSSLESRETRLSRICKNSKGFRGNDLFLEERIIEYCSHLR